MAEIGQEKKHYRQCSKGQPKKIAKDVYEKTYEKNYLFTVAGIQTEGKFFFSTRRVRGKVKEVFLAFGKYSTVPTMLYVVRGFGVFGVSIRVLGYIILFFT